MLNCPTRSDRKNYKYLPVSTSYEQELAKTAEDILLRCQNQAKPVQDPNAFIANETAENARDELVLLKLKGYIDQKDITGKSTEIKKLPSKVQVGTVIEGDPIVASKIRVRKGQSSFADYFLKEDEDKQFTKRKFTELQRINQRKKKLKRRIIAKKQKNKKNIRK